MEEEEKEKGRSMERGKKKRDVEEKNRSGEKNGENDVGRTKTNEKG